MAIEITEEEFKALKESADKATDFQSQLEKVNAKNQELLSEKKREQEKARAAEEAAKKEQEEKLLASNNYEELHKSSEEERKKALQELQELKDNIAKEKRDNVATKVAAELAEGSNVELLAEFVARRLKHADDGIKVLNESGELTVSTLDDLKRDFQSDARYASLLKGNQSSGGGANGGSDGSGASKEKSRAEFDALDQSARSEFIKSGGTVVE
jgi:hypothetical protein